MSKLKSIAILSVHTCPVAALGGKKTGGMNVYVRDLARELGHKGIKVDIFTRCESLDSPEVRRLGPNVNVIHIPSGPSKTLAPLEIFSFLPEFTANVMNFKRQHQTNYDLIHSHYWLSGLVGLKLKTAWKIPLVQTFHTLGLIKQRFLPGLTEPLARISAEKQLVKKVDLIVAFTADEVDHLQNLYGADPEIITVIPPGVDVNRFRPIPGLAAKTKIKIPQSRRLILFVGRLDPVKRVEVLLSAFKQIVDKTIELVIIGGESGDENLGRLKLLAENLKISGRVKFLGQQDQKILPFYYSAAELTIVPSSYESFGLVAMESMACGTPVVASKVGGLAVLIADGQTGFSIHPNQIRPLTKAVSLLLKNRKLRQEMGLAARRAA
ncbi:glycosyltransferase [Candidatus Collierbacteria bacterium]|nr:glycosyltransferase [Candidatus Collierbacteria bacterium]